MEVKFSEQIIWAQQLKSQEVCSPIKRPCINSGGGSGSPECVPSYSMTSIPNDLVIKSQGLQVTMSFGCNGFGNSEGIGGGGNGNNGGSCGSPPSGKTYSVIVNVSNCSENGGATGQDADGCVKVCGGT